MPPTTRAARKLAEHAAESPVDFESMSTAQRGLMSAAFAITVEEPEPEVLTKAQVLTGRESLLGHVRNCKATTGLPYQSNWHLEQLAAALEALQRGDITRLMVLMPPRHGKSELVSRHFPAWALGKNPAEQIIACSYSADLASTMGVAVQRIMHQPEYREEFHARLAGTSENRGAKATTATKKAERQTFFEIANGPGYYLGAGVGGPITGKGFTLGIVDDPIKNRKEAESKIHRDAVWDWWVSTFLTRGEGGMALGGEERICVCLTPWHEDDLSGRILRNARETGERWVVIRFPALAEDETSLSDPSRPKFEGNPDAGPANGPLFRSSPGWCQDPRQPEQALWPGKFDEAKLKRIKATNAREWAALYQCRPAPDKGTVFEREWWQWYDTPEAVPKMHAHCFSVDASFKDLESSSYCVLQLWGIQGADRYLLKQWRRRLEFPTLLDLCRSVFPLHPEAVTKLIEEKANGAALISMMRTEFPGLVPINPRDSKYIRAISVQDFVRAGNVYLPRYEPWAHELVDEAAAFPNGLHDDMVDCMVQMLLHYQYNPVSYLEDIASGWAWLN